MILPLTQPITFQNTTQLTFHSSNTNYIRGINNKVSASVTLILHIVLHCSYCKKNTWH
jgi:hypothetical protein